MAGGVEVERECVVGGKRWEGSKMRRGGGGREEGGDSNSEVGGCKDSNTTGQQYGSNTVAIRASSTLTH